MSHLSEETKAKISIALKGKHFTEEHKAKISASQKGKPGHMLGKHHTAEARAKIGASNKGKHDMRGERNPIFGRRGEKAPMFGKRHTEEARAKISASRMGKNIGKHHHHTEEYKAKMSATRMGENNPFFGKHPSKEHRAKISAGVRGERNGMFGKHHTKEAGAKMSASRKGRRRSEEATRKMMLAMNVKPNVPERKLINILSDNWPNEWKYVGDGQVIFDGLNPDFINCNGKKLIIELFGDYWHSPEIIDSWRRSELGRIMVYSQFGYKTLIIWEHELRDEDKVIARIAKFSNVNTQHPAGAR